MYLKLSQTITKLYRHTTTPDRKELLTPLIDYIQRQYNNKEIINLNFICLNNSRRSHLAQIWAQVMSYHYEIPYVNCYSGGNQETALSTDVVDTLVEQGFTVSKITEGANPVYLIKYSDDQLPIIGLSKKYDHPSNPKTDFAAILTCTSADKKYPLISGATERFIITYVDPKKHDEAPNKKELYNHSSMEIASELFYIFSQIQK